MFYLSYHTFLVLKTISKSEVKNNPRLPVLAKGVFIALLV